MATESKPEKRGRGRPPKDGKSAMSSAERQRQYRTRLKESGASDAYARKALEFLTSCTRRLRAALEAGDREGVRLEFLGVENNVALLHQYMEGRRVPDMGGKFVKLGAPLSAKPAPPPVDTKALQAILTHSRGRLDVANTQIEWLHEAITPETSAAITGPAWQLRFAVADWQATIDSVSAVLDGKGAEVPELWTRQRKPAAKRGKS
ncbi:hypothetical protein C5748_07380 [Phyllobacterium phragmitis]|uniref:Uncharacterized protein n=1 Tax=Phyllobacterium phragmitis TaxID=2670329 RepID=A0A2S9IV28_9HYPH|nr:hypothetical protein [Phyllobacterium phragmitis]PRD44392.1 hypothetical protein C5748_07380 [Phyllobacterium phragmitis]